MEKIPEGEKMITRLEQLLVEIAKEPLNLNGLTEKELKFLDLVSVFNKNPENYNLYFYYIARFNQTNDLKYERRN